MVHFLKNSNTAITVIALSAFTIIAGCKGGEKVKSKRAGINEAIVHISADPQRLNPITSSESYSTQIENQVFQQLLNIGGDSLNIVPILATARPVVTPIEDGEYKGGLSMAFELRPEAKWDNGTPITASDVEFSLKCLKNPLVDCEAQRGYMQFIDDIKIDAQNPRKFTFFCKGHYLLSEISAGTYAIIPEYIYDPNKLMREFSVKELNDTNKTEKFKNNPKIIEFAKTFNSEKYQREQGGVVGSGPYEFVEWTTTQHITLKRKANWWGDALAKAGNKNFNAGVDKITYQIIPDFTTAVTAFKDEGLDVGNNFKTADYVGLQKNEEFKKRYNLATPQYMAFVYIGMNMKRPQLEDKKVRQALSYAIDKQYIINTYIYNLASPIVGPINPAKSYYNTSLKPYAFDLEKAKKLLDEAGWKDSDGDGIRDKTINGEKVDLKLVYKYPTSAPGSTAENVGLLLKENCAKIGVGIELLNKEWTVFLDENKKHDFDIYYGSWVNDAIPDDLYQIWHSQSYSNGDDYTGFGTAESDALIEKIRYEIDDNKRKDMYMRFQEIIYDECPYIFLFTPKNKIAIHKRFDNANAVVKRPGYEVNQFKLNPGFGVKAVPGTN